MAFTDLKKGSKNNFANLTKKLDDDKKGSYGDDTRYWNFKVDEAGNGYAVIRFLPAPDGEEFPFVKLYKHSFKNKRTNKWYIENSLTTIGETDPVSEYNSELWNNGGDAGKDQAREQKRQQKYISNILVISDSKNPQNEGKVMLWEYGPRIFQKIEGAMKPEFEDETALNPFDLWEGANFKLKARKLDGQRSYDKSEFEKPAPLFAGDDAALEKLWKSEYPLQPEIAKDKFKSYDVLKARLNAVLGNASVASNQAAATSRSNEPQSHQEDSQPQRSNSAPQSSDEDADYETYKKLLQEP